MADPTIFPAGATANGAPALDLALWADLIDAARFTAELFDGCGDVTCRCEPCLAGRKARRALDTIARRGGM